MMKGYNGENCGAKFWENYPSEFYRFSDFRNGAPLHLYSSKEAKSIFLVSRI